MKKKNKTLIVLFVIIITMIISIIVVVMTNKENNTTEEQILINELYGSWTSEYLEIYKNNKLDTKNDNISRNIVNIYDNKTLSICLSNEVDNCIYINYEYNDDILTVEENDTFFSGKLNIKISNGYLVTISSIDDNKMSYLYYSKNNILEEY